MNRLPLLTALALLCVTLFSGCSSRYDAVVASDGSGDYTTLQEAFDAVPDWGTQRYTIYVKDGVYDSEKLIIRQSKRNVSIVGQSREGTVISYNMYNCDSPKTGNMRPEEAWHQWRRDSDTLLVRTTATLTIAGEGCCIENLTIRNTAGPVGQALAITVVADKTTFRNCILSSYQDTCYLWPDGIRIFFDNCLVIGRTDYIYGGAIAFFEGCEIRSWGGGWVTAPSTPLEQKYGFVFSHCSFTYRMDSPRKGDDGRTFAIGRPWHNYPKVAIINSEYCDELDPLGWPTIWHMDYAETSEDLHLYEYGNTGARADMSTRAKWAGIREMTAEEAEGYTTEKVFGEDPSLWLEPEILPASAVPTVYLIGDSTCAIKTDEVRPECGWGEKFQQFFKDGAAVVDDRAANGRSTKSFKKDGRWDEISGILRKGDYVFIQFGHNDQNVNKPERYCTPEDFCRNLCDYVCEAREKGATPILLTPICRRYYNETGPYHCHGVYPDMVKQAAAQTNCALIDMEQITFDWLCTMTADEAATYFITKDKTHLNYEGAELVAGMVASHIPDTLSELAVLMK